MIQIQKDTNTERNRQQPRKDQLVVHWIRSLVHAVKPYVQSLPGFLRAQVVAIMAVVHAINATIGRKSGLQPLRHCAQASQGVFMHIQTVPSCISFSVCLCCAFACTAACLVRQSLVQGLWRLNIENTDARQHPSVSSVCFPSGQWIATRLGYSNHTML